MKKILALLFVLIALAGAGPGRARSCMLSGCSVNSSFDEDSTTILRNHGVGLQTNLNTETEAMATATPANSAPIPNALYRFNWVDVEGTEGVRDFSSLTNFMARARADNQLVNFRMYEQDPGSPFCAPTWTRTCGTCSGWQASHDDGAGTTCTWPDFDDTDVTTKYGATVQAMATAIANYPGPYQVDWGWGAYNENNYSGTHYTNASVTGIAPTPIGGTGNELPTPLPTSKAVFAGLIATAFPPAAGRNIYTFPDDQVTYDDGAALGFGGRQDGFAYRNVVVNALATPGSCPGAGVQMCTLDRKTFAANYNSLVVPGASTPTPIAAPTISQPNQYQTKPIMQEIWSTFSTWTSSVWPCAYSFQWFTDNHNSQINTKNTFAFSACEPYFGNALKTAGYRHYLQTISHSRNATSGSSFSITTRWVNHGVAPQTLGHTVLFKLCRQGGTGAYPDCVKFDTGTAALWLPNVDTPITSSITPPTYLTPGRYDVYVGIGRTLNSTWIQPEEILANTTPTTSDGWYTISSVNISNTVLATPTPNDYSGSFANASSRFLSLADSDAVSMNGTDFTVVAGVYATTLNGFVIAAKGDVGATGQEWSLYTDGGNSQRFTARVSTTATLRTTACNTFGNPTTSTWYWVFMEWNNTAKTLKCSVNNGTEDSNTFSGTISNTTNAFRLGADTVGRYWDGRIDKFRLWKRTLTAGEKTAIYNSGTPLKVEDMTNAQRKGLFLALELDEASGTRADSWQMWRYTDNGTVGQAARYGQ